MKIYKKIVLMIAITMMSIATISCDSFSFWSSESGKSNDSTENSEGTNNGVNNTDNAQEVKDSIENFKIQLEELASENKKLSEDIDNLKNEIKKKDQLSMFDIATLVIALIALVIAIFGLTKFENINKRIDKRKEEINTLNSQLHSLQQFSNNQRSTQSMQPQVGDSELRQRVSALENQIKNMPQAYNQQQSPSVKPNVSPVNQISTGYFGIPTSLSGIKAGFRKILSVSDTDARFTAEIRGDEATFSIKEGAQYLNEIKSSDNLKHAIDGIGCSISEASHMKTKAPGKAKKENDRWVITQKTKIIFTK